MHATMRRDRARESHRRISLVLFAALLSSLALPGGEMPTGTFDARLASLTERLAPALMEVHYTASSGPDRWTGRQLGVLVREDGLVLTDGALRRSGTAVESVEVRFPGDGARVPAVYVGKHEDMDLAFLRVPVDRLPPAAAPVPLAETATPPPGATVALVSLVHAGNTAVPFVQAGRIMAHLPAPFPRYLTDLPVHVASPCAPVVDLEGRAVGVTAPSSSRDEAPQGRRTFLLFPAEAVAKLAAHPPEEAKEREKRHGWLGIVMGALSPSLARHWGVEAEGGVIASQVLPDSPAAAAGMRAGDILVAFDGVPVPVRHESQLQAFVHRVKQTPTGKSVPVEVLRPRPAPEGAGEGEDELRPLRLDTVNLDVTLGIRPPSALYGEFLRDAFLGLTLKAITVEDRLAHHLDPEVEGVLVEQVEDGSWAHLADVMRGDIIARIDDRAVPGLEAYRTVLTDVLARKPEAILLFLHRGGGTVFRVVEPRY